TASSRASSWARARLTASTRLISAMIASRLSARGAGREAQGLVALGRERGGQGRKEVLEHRRGGGWRGAQVGLDRGVYRLDAFARERLFLLRPPGAEPDQVVAQAGEPL